jgi:hypothetical protein
MILMIATLPILQIQAQTARQLQKVHRVARREQELANGLTQCCLPKPRFRTTQRSTLDGGCALAHHKL